MADPKQDAAVAPTVVQASLMPWEVDARLRCLDAARDAARQRAVSDVLPIADEYFRWAVTGSRTKPEAGGP